ncbi:MAG: sporulation protein YtxC [Eubacteriales bacterium]|jgi:putative sporulation protein YtxC
MHRRSAILKILLDYITTADMIMIKGFIEFRLKDYLIELTEIVDKAVDNFLLEKDYTEFIHLLRRLKETNEPRADIVHVVFSEGFFKLCDKRGKLIKGDLLEKVDIEQGQNEIGCGDLLISLLVSLVPDQIMFHSCGYDQTAAVQKIIRDIFPGQFKECDGCNLCLKN